ncbi:MAG: hypothetical protein LKF75_03140 [Bacilli bacterium]|jgi:hypothetical protein|nr:hypothetical protein [Bacilli bacterium]
MQKKLLLSLVSVGAVAVGAGVVATHGQDLTVAEEGYSYSCAGLNWTGGVNEDGTPKSVAFISDGNGTNYGDGIGYNITLADCGYTATNTGLLTGAASGVKIGGSKSGKYAGSLKITLPSGTNARRVSVWASPWSGEPKDSQIAVNGSATQTVPAATFTATTWTSYTFDITSNNVVTITNGSPTGKARIIVGMVVLRAA